MDANATGDEHAESAVMSEDVTRQLLERISDAVFSTDRDWVYTFISPQFERIIGRTAEELLGKNMWEAFPDAEDAFRPPYERALAENRLVTFRQYYQPLDLWLDLRVYPSKTGVTVFFMEANEAVALERQLAEERTQLQQALEEQRRLTEQFEAERMVLQEAIDNANAHIAYLDADFNFVMVNSTYATGSGHTVDELVGKNHFEIFPNEENERIFTLARDTGEPIEYAAKPFDFADQPWRGTTYWDWRLTPVKDRSSHVTGLVLSLVDVTREHIEARINDSLGEIESSIHSTLERDEVLRRVAEQSAAAIGAHSVVLAMREGEQWVVRYAFNMKEEVIGQGFTVRQAPFMGIAADTRRPIAIDDAFDDPRTSLKTQEYLGVRSVMMAPLIVRDEVLGGLFFNYYERHDFTDLEVMYASRLSASIGLAIANIALYEAERDVADRLQDALLSLPDELPGLEVAHAYHSASDSARVGGDFYDLFELEHDRVGVMIGDVAGKGLDAAVLTSLMKNAARTHAYDEGKTPCQILALTDAIVYRETAPEVFATAFYGVLDRASGGFEYCNAGHTTGAVVRADGRVDKLQSTGPLLGAIEGGTFDASDTRMDAGDTLLLYTDGLTEARRSGEFYGEDRLFLVLQSADRTSAQAIVDSVLSDVVAFTAGRLDDDLALLALRRLDS